MVIIETFDLYWYIFLVVHLFLDGHLLERAPVSESTTFSDVQSVPNHCIPPKLVSNDMAHKRHQIMGGQARFKVHPSSHGREGKPTSQEAICIGSHSTPMHCNCLQCIAMLSLTRVHRTQCVELSKNTLQTSLTVTAFWPQCFHPTTSRQIKANSMKKVLQICNLMEWFNKTWQRPKRGQFSERSNKFMNSVRALPMLFSAKVKRLKWR